MIRTNPAVLLALVAPLALGLPSPGKDFGFKTTTANYDDIPANPLLNTGMTTKPPSPYKGLCYQNVGVGNYSLNVAGFMPHSEPNALYNAPEETLAQPAIISTNKCNAGGTFTAYSIYVACILPTGAGDLATVPEACTVKFTGTKKSGRTVTQQATYTPPGELNGAMQKVSLSGFDSLVSLSAGGSGISQATAVLFLDDFTYAKDGGRW